MTFTDRTDLIATSPRAELQRLALYLQGDCADLTVHGENARWLVVLYKNGPFESRAHTWWRTSGREAGIALARQVERCLAGAASFDDGLAQLPDAVRAAGIRITELPAQP